MEKKKNPLLLFVFFFIYCVAPVISNGSDHLYKVGDDVPLYANKVGPFHSPSETYRYFDLPFCSSAPVKKKKESLGEFLNGDRLVSAPYKLEFLGEKNSEVACRKRLSRDDVAKFRDVISKDYYFQMYYDDLPIWGFLGKVVKDGKSDPSEYKYYLFNHLQFEIFYNKDRVIEIIVRTDQNFLVDLSDDKEVEVDFTYTVRWKETEIPFEKRMEKYSLASSMPHHLEIHWFSIINSCVTVLLLTGFLATILMRVLTGFATILMRVLKNDFIKYAHDEEAADDQEETGRKLIHSDVYMHGLHGQSFLKHVVEMEFSCGHYSNKHKILLVGEGDFSFSLCLARSFGSATNITATSLDTREELERKYADAKKNVEELENLGCTVVHGVDVHSMNRYYCVGRTIVYGRPIVYDRIIFNFPHAGFDFGRESDSFTIMKHQEVVSGFFTSARELVKYGGEIHVTHKIAHPFASWNIKTLGEKKGLYCYREMEFGMYHYPGYSNKRGSGRDCDSSFPVGESSTFMFKKHRGVRVEVEGCKEECRRIRDSRMHHGPRCSCALHEHTLSRRTTNFLR